ncbi:50S ribosomal protein L2 [Magnaporthiopsis poae ATCC 64411]|uniref:Large ribosomal subunit protein uL2m n=1 Tax=Magnaporthiopsis poae (strain ATCC 64411 / 73-15) TaxID=644358 RepID=A0A0C4E2B6_MAGP6|nr:50S ribosomal protein L2 [Magnaporthiopsis poae ATCC 64411]
MLQPRLIPMKLAGGTLSAACRAVMGQCFRRGYATPSVQPTASTPTSGAPGGSGLATAFKDRGNETTTVLMRTYKPRTPGLRHLKRPINDHIWKGRPYMRLTFPKKGMSKGGRNNQGRITVRHRGGGVKRRIRTVDFQRSNPGPHTVERIEYDPGRSAHIALLVDQATKKKSYIVAAEGMRAGDVVQSYRAGIPQDLLDSMGGVIDPGILAAKTAFRGNCLPVHLIPVQTMVYNVGSTKDRGAVFCRSAGTYAIIVSKDEETRADGSKIMTGKYVTVRLQSGEVRRISKDACATIGQASNIMHQYRQLGKAGRSRWLNIRPTVRGVAMNSVDHPHGGGRGKSKGRRHPTSPWGTPAKGGYKTRRKSNINKWVVVPRVRNQGKRRNKSSRV